jgi:dGTPase
MNVVAKLAPYAADDSQSRGRRFDEPKPPYRGEYQRDRDRIVHTAAFRRLVYKTQVFVNHEGDHYRTRLTHSLEVAQIARTVARALALNEDLVEAISLAHDLGHTAFGHAGQDALNACMRDYGGFEHNLQSLRVVDELEARYAAFRGLNLTFETREGILKHCSIQNARQLGELGQRFLERQQPGLEAQIANIADEIAYNNHDVDDGLRAGLIGLEQLEAIPFFAARAAAVRARYPDAAEPLLAREIIRSMIDHLVTDLITTSRRQIEAAAPTCIDEVRAAGAPLIGLGEDLASGQRALKRFLRSELYAHPRVERMTRQAHTTITELFEAFTTKLDLMPAEHAERARAAERATGAAGRARIVADYIAGMTDRFALDTHSRLSETGITREPLLN